MGHGGGEHAESIAPLKRWPAEGNDSSIFEVLHGKARKISHRYALVADMLKPTMTSPSAGKKTKKEAPLQWLGIGGQTNQPIDNGETVKEF
jgi:hypothetical protein